MRAVLLKLNNNVVKIMTKNFFETKIFYTHYKHIYFQKKIINEKKKIWKITKFSKFLKQCFHHRGHLWNYSFHTFFFVSKKINYLFVQTNHDCIQRSQKSPKTKKILNHSFFFEKLIMNKLIQWNFSSNL